jgi:hypothetical protein
MKAPVASPAKTVDASSIRMTISGLAVRQLAPTEPSLMGIVEGDDPHEGLSQRSVLTLIVSSAHGVLKADQGPIQSCYGQVDEISDRHACLSPSAAAPPSYGRASHGRPTYGRRYRGFVPSSTLLVRCPVTSRELVGSGAIQPVAPRSGSRGQYPHGRRRSLDTGSTPSLTPGTEGRTR